MWKCPNIEPGQAVRTKLKEKNRCDACYTPKNEHTICSSLPRQCTKCFSWKHYENTCSGTHAGSWMLK